jgi:hypothetical protein
MDTSVDDILSRFDRYKETHPNIVTLWKNYINIKKQNMLKIIQESHDVLSKLETVNDIPLNDLTLFCVIQSTLHSNIT